MLKVCVPLLGEKREGIRDAALLMWGSETEKEERYNCQEEV